MSIFWYFLMALGFLIVVMMAVPDDAPPPPPPAIELGTAPSSIPGRAP